MSFCTMLGYAGLSRMDEVEQRRIEKLNDDLVATTILKLCEKRGAGKTICPSEAARALATHSGAWRSHMDDVRRVGFELMRTGRIVVTQRGEKVDPSNVRGPIRFALVQAER